jgi:hypothetical protein
MRKLRITLMTVLGSILITNGAVAQNKPLACQVEASAGLTWENGRWLTKSFQLSRFILVQTRNTLTIDSVAKAIQARPINVSCRNISTTENIECTDASGGSLYIDLKTFKGGVSQLHGSTDTETARDTVSVQVFSCTAF